MVEEMGIRKMAGMLLELSAEHHDEEHWLDAVHGCRRVAADPAGDRLSSTGGFSFRYGGMYLSASRHTAAGYALFYPGGGEALTYTMQLYQLLAGSRPELVRNEEFTRLLAFIQRPGRPMLVEASGIDLSLLRTEQGGPIHEVLTRIEAALEDPDFYEDLTGQLNFELTGPVRGDNLRFHNVAEELEWDEAGASERVLRFSEVKL